MSEMKTLYANLDTCHALAEPDGRIPVPGRERPSDLDPRVLDSRLQRHQQGDRCPPEEIEPPLKVQFGYQHYQLLGVQQEPLKADKVYRLNLGEGFVVFVTRKAWPRIGMNSMWNGPPAKPR